ncbi:uncharacterized protein LOC109835215 [Asparagus officinalis]|nr:uncharacterized protein LOC109835215 [Asparagus officinalis]
MGSQWVGCALPDVLPMTPDEGPVNVNRARGITAIGASPWIDTFNIPFLSTDIATVKRIARSVSARGGGLPSVQNLCLDHGDGCVEIACMLLDPKRVGADLVEARVKLIAAQEGLKVEKGYFTDFSQDMIVERYIKLVSVD